MFPAQEILFWGDLVSGPVETLAPNRLILRLLMLTQLPLYVKCFLHYRIPMLSVISESNTLTSLSQNSASSENDSNDLFEDTALNGILPDDDAANDNEISFVGYVVLVVIRCI